MAGASKSNKLTIGGVLMRNTGLGTSAIGVTTFDDGRIEVGMGTLNLTRALYGNGALRIDAGATLGLGASAAKTITATFNGPSATLAIAAPKRFAATISGFAATDTIDLLHIKATGASISATRGKSVAARS